MPLTGSKVVDLIITEKCVFEVNKEDGLTLIEIAEGADIADILSSTGCEFKVFFFLIKKRKYSIIKPWRKNSIKRCKQHSVVYRVWILDFNKTMVVSLKLAILGDSTMALLKSKNPTR